MIEPILEKITKTFNAKIGNDYYEKSSDPNIIFKWSRNEVYLRGIEMSLENQIKRLENRIKAIEEAPPPEPVEPAPIDTTELEKQKTDLESLFNQLKGIK